MATPIQRLSKPFSSLYIIELNLRNLNSQLNGLHAKSDPLVEQFSHF